MLKLTNSVRLQLRLAFAFVIVISFVSTAIAIWRFQVLSAETEALTHRPLVKERLIGQWLLNLSVSTKRTAAVARAADPALATAFAEESRQSSERTNALQEKVASLLDTQEERQRFADAAEARKLFIDTRDRVMQLKAKGSNDEGLALYEHSFTPAAQRYVDQVQAMLTLQQQSIDVSAGTMLRQAHHAELAIISLCAVTLIGSLAAWALFSRSLFRRLGGEPSMAAAIATDIAAGNLAVEIALQAGDRNSLLHALLRLRDSLADIVGQVRDGSTSIAASIDAVTAETQDLAMRTERQAAALEESASSMQQLTEDVRRSEEYVEQARQLALDASTVAQQGGGMVKELVDVMGTIDASSARIADIVSVIDGIAFQTNILALNAAVEAARAGEQGRGFAVVATEVRALAQRSATAAREIKGLIDDSTQRAASGADLAGRAGASMAAIVDGIGGVTGMMDRIVISTHEQSSGIRQVHQAISDMDEVTQQNAALAEESAVASQTMREQALALSRQVAMFKLEDEKPATPRHMRSAPPGTRRLASPGFASA
jgi:methyl-accepting chemotaxis protein